MLEKFRRISQDLLSVKGSSFSNFRSDRFSYVCQFGCKSHIGLFKELEIEFSQVYPPDWIFQDKKLYGSYLAGVIDGDGDVRISRKNIVK